MIALTTQAIQRWLERDPAAAAKIIESAIAGVPQLTDKLPGADTRAVQVWVYNGTGGALDYASVLDVADGLVYSVADNDEVLYNHGHCFSGTTPDSSTGSKFVVLAEPCPIGEVVRAWLSGCCWVQVAVGNAAHTHASSTAADATKLTSGTSGPAEIVYKPAGTGTLWCIVRICGLTAIAGQNNNPSNPKVLASSGASANADTWDIDTDAATYDGVQYVASRMYWSGTAGDSVYYYTRTATHDAAGRLVAVSAETRTELGDTETFSCPT